MGAELFESKVVTEVLTSEEVIDFLNSFNRPIVCQICGNQQWIISATNKLSINDNQPDHVVIETIGYAQFLPEEDSAINYPGGLPVIRATCECCGHILLFSYKKLRALIKNKKENSEVTKGE